MYICNRTQRPIRGTAAYQEPINFLNPSQYFVQGYTQIDMLLSLPKRLVWKGVLTVCIDTFGISMKFI